MSGVVFTKTAKGQAEMANRSGALSPRIRRILILVDGRRSVDALRDVAVADDLTHTLGLLEEEGYIEVAGVADPTSGVVSSDAPLPPVTEFRPLPADPVTPELYLARNFMVNSVRSFAGHYEHISLVAACTNAQNHAELRSQFDAWYHAIVATRDGRRRGEELREQLLRVL